MNKQFNVGFGVFFAALLAVSCSKDDVVTEDKISVEWGIITNSNQPVVLPAGSTGVIPFKASGLKSVVWSGVPEGWSVSVNATSDTLRIKAPEAGISTPKEWTLDVKLTSGSGDEVVKSFNYYYLNSFDDPKGTFILNEGNMTTENGSLLYITPEGYMVDDAYKLVNGTELGNVCQDMFFYQDKIYIISQNGDTNPVGTKFENDGMLVILDAKTLKRIDSYKKEELSSLAWPSHVAVLDEEHVYIRDNGVREGDNGSGKVWRLNTKDRTLVEVKNTQGVPKAPLFVRNGKIYALNVTKGPIGNKFNILEISTAADEAIAYNRTLTSPEKPVSLVPSKEENTFWVLWKDDLDVYMVSKVRLLEAGKLLNLAPLCALQEGDDPNWGASGVILVPEKDTQDAIMHKTVGTFYYTTATCVVKCTYTEGYSDTSSVADLDVEYVLELSDLDNNARMVYNGMAIHPETGHLYVNTIKGMGMSYITNKIWELAVEGENAKVVHDWSNYTKFPAGFFFSKAHTIK